MIRPDLAATIGRAVGFRNVLVHQYATVDDTIVLGVVDDLGVFRDFVAQVSRWVLDTDHR